MAIMNPVNTPLERLDVLKLEKLRSLAKARGIKKLDHESALITPVARNAVLPLSFVQQGLWLQVQLEGARKSGSLRLASGPQCDLCSS
jgi:hypothetical protein